MEHRNNYLYDISNSDINSEIIIKILWKHPVTSA